MVTMTRSGVACLTAALLLIVCASSAQAWRLFPSFTSGFWNETSIPACPSFNATSEPDPFRKPPHVEHNHSSIEHGAFEHNDHSEHDNPEPRPHPPGPHPKPPHPPGPHPPHPPRPFPGPPFYHGMAGPRFHVVNRTCGYETRVYNDSTWAVTNTTGWSWEFAVHHGFVELDPYFHGENANNSHFPPSIPVVSHFLASKDFSDTGKQFRVARYVPKKCHSNHFTVPAPDNDKIQIKTSPAHYTTYVRTFPGLGLHWAVLGEMRALHHDLKRDGINVKNGEFFVAQYDPPTAIFHRHNEIWFIPSSKNKTEADSVGLWNVSGKALDANIDQSS